ncbi:hypothetical protein O0L34_g7501 [Tuta absoluta]|nr:hypothetical protein O0L34_g7501 [Tuta absoluta]
MSLVTSRHHSKITRGARSGAGDGGTGGRSARRPVADWLRGARGGGGGRSARARPAPCGLACVGLRTSHVTQPSSTAPSEPTLRRHNRVKKAPAYPNERRH